MTSWRPMRGRQEYEEGGGAIPADRPVAGSLPCGRDRAAVSSLSRSRCCAAALHTQNSTAGRSAGSSPASAGCSTEPHCGQLLLLLLQSASARHDLEGRGRSRGRRDRAIAITPPPFGRLLGARLSGLGRVLLHADEVDRQRPVGEVRPLAERHLQHEHRDDAHEVDDVDDVRGRVEARAVQQVLQHAGHGHDEQQDEEHPVRLVRVGVLRRVLLDAAAQVEHHGDDQPGRGQVAEDVHAPVDAGPARHLLQEEHDQHQHGDVAQHEREMHRPRPLAFALLVLGLGEEVQRQRVESGEVRARQELGRPPCAPITKRHMRIALMPSRMTSTARHRPVEEMDLVARQEGVRAVVHADAALREAEQREADAREQRREQDGEDLPAPRPVEEPAMPLKSYFDVSQRRMLIIVSPGSASLGHCSEHSPQ